MSKNSNDEPKKNKKRSAEELLSGAKKSRIGELTGELEDDETTITINTVTKSETATTTLRSSTSCSEGRGDILLTHNSSNVISITADVGVSTVLSESSILCDEQINEVDQLSVDDGISDMSNSCSLDDTVTLDGVDLIEISCEYENDVPSKNEIEEENDYDEDTMNTIDEISSSDDSSSSSSSSSNSSSNSSSGTGGSSNSHNSLNIVNENDVKTDILCYEIITKDGLNNEKIKDNDSTKLENNVNNEYALKFTGFKPIKLIKIEKRKEENNKVVEKHENVVIDKVDEDDKKEKTQE